MMRGYGAGIVPSATDTRPRGGEVVVKRIAGIVVAALTLAVVPAGTASAYLGAPNLHIFETRTFVKADGPGFDVKLTKQGLDVQINDAKFGIPEAGFPIQRFTQNFGPNPNRRPFVCENGTYRIVQATFNVTNRPSQPPEVDRPLPYTPAFNNAFPSIFTFVGAFQGTVTNEAGEQFTLYMSDLAHEVMGEHFFSSTNPIHAYFVDAQGKIRDRASLVGRINVHLDSGKAFHWILDRGTCHQTANLNLGEGTDQATVFGPFFVLPFNTTVVRL
jgi:hypothetical protein